MEPGDVCVDSDGRELRIGADFDGAAYPVYVAQPLDVVGRVIFLTREACGETAQDGECFLVVRVPIAAVHEGRVTVYDDVVLTPKEREQR